MGLGSLSAFTLAEARERARLARQLLADGVDPLVHRNEERARRATEAATAAARNVTFAEAAQRYFEFHSPKWSNEKTPGAVSFIA